MNKKVRKQRTILGVSIDSTRKSQVLALALESIQKNKKFFIVTPNPEIILASTRDQKLKEILNSSDLAICDGIGLSFASRFLYGEPLERLTGRDLFEELLKLASEKKLKVFLLGSSDKVVQKSLGKITKLYPKVKIEGESGPLLNNNAETVAKRDTSLQNDIVKKINQFKPDILFVAFGAPKQEKWVANHLKNLNTKVVMVIGGTLDTFSGVIIPVPDWLSSLGLEWLWRLIQQPSRIHRIFNAVIVFPLLVVKEKFFR